jgi:hypothetical protein
MVELSSAVGRRAARWPRRRSTPIDGSASAWRRGRSGRARARTDSRPVSV